MNKKNNISIDKIAETIKDYNDKPLINTDALAVVEDRVKKNKKICVIM